MIVDKEDKKPHVLIVDDERANVRILSSGLKEQFSISVCKDGHQALAFIESNSRNIDLILLDIVMPGLSGYIVCHTLKQKTETKNIPVIFITAKATPESETKGLEAGAVDYITKPFNMDVVRARVDTHVRLKAQSDLLKKLLSEQSVKVKQFQSEFKRLFEK
jgi:DNA-binding response OmpR family regulator